MSSGNEHHFKSNRNVFYSCKYRVVWCPKYRHKVMVNGMDKHLKEIIRQTAQEFQVAVIELEIKPDHVHLLYEVYPQFGIHRLVRYLKGQSSHLLRQEFSWLRSRLPVSLVDQFIFCRHCWGHSPGSYQTVHRESEECLNELSKFEH